MVSEHALMIAGWTVLTTFVLAASCTGLWLFLSSRKAAEVKQRQEDLEHQKSRIRMVQQTLQVGNPILPVSLPDPFSTNVRPTAQPFSLLRNPDG